MSQFLESPAVGGAPNKTDPEVFAVLLNDMAEEGLDKVDTSDRAVTKNKRVILFPLSLFQTSTVMKICDGKNINK